MLVATSSSKQPPSEAHIDGAKGRDKQDVQQRHSVQAAFRPYVLPCSSGSSTCCLRHNCMGYAGTLVRAERPHPTGLLASGFF